MPSPEKTEVPVPSREEAVESLDKIVKAVQQLDEQYEADSSEVRQALKTIKADFKALVKSFPKELAAEIQMEIDYVEKLLKDMNTYGQLGVNRYIGSPTVQLPSPERVEGKMFLSPTPGGNVIDLGNTKLRAGDLVISFALTTTPRGMMPSKLVIEGGEAAVDARKAETLLVPDWKNTVDPEMHDATLNYAKQLYAHKVARPAVESVRAFTQTPGSGFMESYDYQEYQDFLQTKIAFYQDQITRVAGGQKILR